MKTHARPVRNRVRVSPVALLVIALALTIAISVLVSAFVVQQMFAEAANALVRSSHMSEKSIVYMVQAIAEFLAIR